ncbi:MAG TPA: hypothetical protein VGL19_17995, partial [Polyangiaceae bacterium]
MQPAQIRVRLVPPDFKACVAHLDAVAKQEAARELGEGITPEGGSAKTRCQKRYEKLLKETVKRWISGEWVVHGAEEAGVAATDRLVNEEYVKEIGEDYKSYAEYEDYLRETKQTKDDMLRTIRVTLDGERIRSSIGRKAADVTPADLRRYYRIHPLQFKVPQRRDLFIVRLKTKAEAEKVKLAITRGRSFASVAKASTINQPLLSKDGFVHGLVPGFY